MTDKRYRILFTSQAKADAKKLNQSKLKEKCSALLKIIAQDPYHIPPPYEKLSGELKGRFSRRINIQHRLVYRVDENLRIVKILRMWTHYA